MNILVHAKNGEATQAVRSFITQQIKKLEKLGVPIRQVQVFLENIARKDSDPHRASVQVDLDVPGVKKLSVRSRAYDLYQAVVEASQDAIRKVRKAKEKHLTQTRKQQRLLVRDIEE